MSTLVADFAGFLGLPVAGETRPALSAASGAMAIPIGVVAVLPWPCCRLRICAATRFGPGASASAGSAAGCLESAGVWWEGERRRLLDCGARAAETAAAGSGRNLIVTRGRRPYFSFLLRLTGHGTSIPL